MAATDEVSAEWLLREKKLFDKIDGAVEYYVKYTRRNQRWQRITSLSVMVLSTAAPLVVVGSGVENGSFGFSDEELNTAGVVITFVLALLEGIRRIFRFEQRWATCYTVKATIKRDREKYRYARIGLAVGSDEWKANLEALRKSFDEATGKETQEFFAAVQEGKGTPATNLA